MERDGIPLEAVELELDFSQYGADPETLVWIPDEMELSMRRTTEEGTEVTRLTWTCLEHLLLLLDQIDSGRSGSVLSGTSTLFVEQSGDRISIQTSAKLVGPREEMRDEVVRLVRGSFTELRSRGLDTESVARDLAEGKFADRGLDVVSLHDRLLGST